MQVCTSQDLYTQSIPVKAHNYESSHSQTKHEPSAKIVVFLTRKLVQNKRLHWTTNLYHVPGSHVTSTISRKVCSESKPRSVEGANSLDLSRWVSKEISLLASWDGWGEPFDKTGQLQAPSTFQTLETQVACPAQSARGPKPFWWSNELTKGQPHPKCLCQNRLPSQQARLEGRFGQTLLDEAKGTRRGRLFAIYRSKQTSLPVRWDAGVKLIWRTC